MHIDLRKSGDVIIVDLKGKLSAGLGDQILRDTIDELLGENWKKILLNLSQVSFMDSAGLRVLVRARERMDAGGRWLLTRGASGQPRRLLEIGRIRYGLGL